MKTDDTNPANWLDEHLEAFLDGELKAEEAQKFERLLEQDGQSQQSLLWAVNIRDELRAVPTPEPPASLQQNILHAVRKEARANQRNSFFSALGALFTFEPSHVLRPALATLTLLVIATTLLFVLNRPTLPQAEPESISQAEIDQALAEAKWALGYVSKTGRMTGTSMQDALAPLLKEQTKK